MTDTPDLGRGSGRAEEQPQQEGMLAPPGSVPARVHGKEAEEEHSARAERRYP